MRPCIRCNGAGVEPDNETLGNSLRNRRKAAGLTLRSMAGLIGISHSFLSQLENGQRTWKRSLKLRYDQEAQKARDSRRMHRAYIGPLVGRDL